MKIATRLAALTLSTGLLFTAAAHAQYGPPQGPPPPPPGYQGGWDAPPQDFQDEVRRNGFQDGIEGARKDYENHRAPNVNNRDEFRHPHVPRGARHDYREGFRRGYDVGVQHMMGGGPGPR